MTDKMNEPNLEENFDLLQMQEVVDDATPIEPEPVVQTDTSEEVAPEEFKDELTPEELSPNESEGGLIEDPDTPQEHLDLSNPVDNEIVINNYIQAVHNHENTIKYSKGLGNVKQVAQICKEEKNWNPTDSTFAIPPMPYDSFLEVLEDSVPREVFEDTSEDNIDFLRAAEAAKDSLPTDKNYANIFQNTDRQWVQSIPSESGGLNISTVRPNNKATTGSSAVFQIGELFGLGGRVQIPLWHSGFWITLEAPSEVSQLDFEDRFLAERVEAARNTYGMVFSNQRSFLVHHLFEFILAHVSYHTIEGDVDLRDFIKIQDINLLALGFAQLIWPNGWQYIRPTFGKDKLQQTKKQRVNISRMCLTDLTSLTENQKTHMSKRREKQSVARIKDYVAQFKFSASRQLDIQELGVPVAEPVKFNLRIPTVNEHVNSGMRWINDIISLFDSFPTISGGEEARNSFVRNRMNATSLRLYEHFVESIEVDEKIVDNQETISSTLNHLSSLDKLREVIITQCDQFITDSTISLAGIPTDDEDEIDISYPRFPNTIPIDPVYLFFIQLVQKNRVTKNRR